MVRMPDGSAEPIGGGGIRYMDKKSFLNIAVPMDLDAVLSTYSYQKPSNTTNKTYTTSYTLSYTFTAKQSSITLTSITNIADTNKVYIKNLAAGYLVAHIPNLSSIYYYRPQEERRFTSFGFVATGSNLSVRNSAFVSASSTELISDAVYISTTYNPQYVEPNDILFDFDKNNKMLRIVPYNISITGILTGSTRGTGNGNSLTNAMTSSLTSEGNDGCRLNILNLDIIEYM